MGVAQMVTCLPAGREHQIVGDKYFVYVLRSKKDNNLYIGFTDNIEARFKLHNKGRIFATKGRRPFELVYKELCASKEEAVKREKYLKSGCGREFIKEQLRHGGCSSNG